MRARSSLERRAHPFDKLHPVLYASEFVGTALLVFVGLSIVIALWGRGAPLANLPLTISERRLFNGALFGATGAAIAFSPIGKISGAHINPAMTFAFWLEGKIKWRDAVGYVIAQFAGGLAGAACLLAWGDVGASNNFGATIPAGGALWLLPIVGETICAFLLVALVFVMAAHKRTQPFTPLINPPLFALLVLWKSPLSGASANPARSVGPAAVAGLWHGQWIYLIAPCLGAALAVGVLRLNLIGAHRPTEARLFHFDRCPHDSVMNPEVSPVLK